MKFGVEHFTVGSVVHTNILNRDRTFTVNDIIQNGINSYILDTGEPNIEIDGINEGYNIDHIDKIISRGTGLSFEQLQNIKLYDPNNCRRYADCKPSTGEFTGFINNDFSGKYANGTYLRIYVFELIELYFRSKINTWQIDLERLLNDLIVRQIMKRCRRNGYYIDYDIINKKKLKKFLKQNINRYLTKLKVILKAEEEEENKMYESDFYSLNYGYIPFYNDHDTDNG